MTYQGGNVTNTDILYFVQDPITRKWFAKVSDETASKMFGERLLSSAGLIPLKEQDYSALASAYGEKKEDFIRLLNETSAQYLPKTGGTTKKKATTQGKSSAPKDSFPAWKSKNPNGTAAQYKQYLAS